MEVIKLTKENFENEVKKSDKPILVDFYADWCGPCQMQGPIVEKLAKENDSFKVGKVNVDEQQELAMEYGVMSIPTLMVVKNGEITYKETGVLQENAILDLMK
ncbi:thioredoxin [Alterileibacterium massiliense]|uniref:thioredoxin n=1 Tax=Alterileibacterium massiliense TaxID=1870997 RepID=UPI0008D9B6BC|nr:thioredoxin [Alterileibacterium massiliense]